MTDVQIIELRYKLLNDAREILFEGWRNRLALEEAVSKFEERAPKNINPPSTKKIMQVAESMFVFTQKGSGGE